LLSLTVFVFLFRKYTNYNQLENNKNKDMKDFFYAIQDLFVNGLFLPLDHLRKLELENWFAANTISWLFLIIGLVAMVYWMKELKKFNDNNEEDKSISSHSFL